MCVDMLLKFVGIIWDVSGMCLGGLRRSLGTTVVNISIFFGWSKKWLGKSRRVLGAPRTPYYLLILSLIVLDF